MTRAKKHTGLKILLLFVIIIAAVIIAYNIRKEHNTFTPDGGYGSYEWSEDMQFDLSLFSAQNLYVDEDCESIKIMQLADPQMKCGFMTHDVRTMQLLEKALNDQDPDIVVCTGDLARSFFTYEAYKYFADFMEAKKQYWTLTYGNHDSEYDMSKYRIAELLSKYEYCLFDPGPSNIKGECNFLINVFKGESTVPSYSLVMIDSGTYPERETEGVLEEWVYDWIGEDQIAWYEWAMNGLKALNPDIKSSMYMHIPIREYADMYYQHQLDIGNTIPEEIDSTDFEEVTGYNGTVCESDKSPVELMDPGYTVGIYYQGKNTGIYDKIKELGVTNAIFAGHDHVNTMQGYYGGIYLAYGLSSGYHTYPFFEDDNIILQLLGLSDNSVINADNWVDENGVEYEKGMTFIKVSLSGESLGMTEVVNIQASEFGE
jgi:hypothetical protein